MDGNLCYIGSECLRKEIISYKCLIVMSEKKVKSKIMGSDEEVKLPALQPS